MRFSPDHRLIDLMVGQLLYSSPDAAMRELVQNAEDACALQQVAAAQYTPRILIRYSKRENWVEVLDNGLGMNEETIQKSFAAVGANKENVAHIKELMEKAPDASQRQIGFFGVGILSCFGVAESVTTWTKMENNPGLAFSIPDYRSEFVVRDDVPIERGTRIQLQLKPNGPMQAEHVPAAAVRYARHAAHVQIEDVDSGEKHNVAESWHGADVAGAIRINDGNIRDGVCALHPNWNSTGAIPPPELILCNGGFLVKARDYALLPPEAIGYVGEVDVNPGGLTIQLNREGFVQDEKWQKLRSRLTAVYNHLILSRVDEWENTAFDELSLITDGHIERSVILLARGPTRSILIPDVLERLDRLLPRAVYMKIRGSEFALPMKSLLDKVGKEQTIYFTRTGEGPRQFQQTVSAAGASVQVTEVAQTEDLRAAHLQAKGALVIACRPRNYGYCLSESAQTLSVHDFDMLSQECQKRSVRLVHVNDATPEEVALAGAADSALFSELLGLGEPLKLIALDAGQNAVLRDFAGRLLNCNHPEVREVLRYLPEAVGNPVRRALLQTYMDLYSYQIESARQRTRQLLTMEDLSEQAQLTTGEFLREFLQSLLRPLIELPEKRDG